MTLLSRVGDLGAIHNLRNGQPISNDEDQSHSRTQITVADGTMYRVEIARLVGFAWGEEFANSLQWQMNHLSRDTTDDSNENLAPATPRSNVPHGRETNPARRKQGPRQGQPVQSWDPDAPGMRNNYTYYESVASAASETGADRPNVCKCRIRHPRPC